jgi:hypothetical protein
MHQTRVGVRFNVTLDSEVPLVTLLAQMHFGITLAVIVIVQAQGSDQLGIHYRSRLEQKKL